MVPRKSGASRARRVAGLPMSRLVAEESGVDQRRLSRIGRCQPYRSAAFGTQHTGMAAEAMSLHLGSAMIFQAWREQNDTGYPSAGRSGRDRQKPPLSAKQVVNIPVPFAAMFEKGLCHADGTLQPSRQRNRSSTASRSWRHNLYGPARSAPTAGPCPEGHRCRRLKMRGGADAGQHQYLRAAKGTCRKHDRTARIDRAFATPALADDDAGCASVVEQ